MSLKKLRPKAVAIFVAVFKCTHSIAKLCRK
jgi:hypothetical protein